MWSLYSTTDHQDIFKDYVSRLKEFATEIIRIEEPMKNPSNQYKGELTKIRFNEHGV